MVFQRLAALMIVASCATLLRLSLVPKIDQLKQPLEGDFSILWASADLVANAGQLMDDQQRNLV